MKTAAFLLAPANGNGWDLSEITTYAAWLNAGFGNQRYDVSVRRVGESTFAPLASTNYQPFSLAQGGGSKVTIRRPGGTLAAGVEAIRFTMLATEGNAGRAVYREFDVAGTAAPAFRSSVLEISPPQQPMAARSFRTARAATVYLSPKPALSSPAATS